MEEPVCAQKFPYALELEAGDYYWCACGRSANQPFCDGSHKETSFTGVKLVSLWDPSQKGWLAERPQAHQ